MFIELANLFHNAGESLTLAHTLDFSNVEFNGEKPFVSPAEVTGVIRNEAGVVSMNAQAVFTFAYACDRCACAAERQMTVRMDHLLADSLNDEENDEFLLIADMRIDLEAFVLEDIFLALPTKFLCKEDCKGLCTQCGKNLNDGPCSCQKPIDPRLEALRQLLDND